MTTSMQTDRERADRIAELERTIEAMATWDEYNDVEAREELERELDDLRALASAPSPDHAPAEIVDDVARSVAWTEFWSSQTDGPLAYHSALRGFRAGYAAALRRAAEVTDEMVEVARSRLSRAGYYEVGPTMMRAALQAAAQARSK